jgi:hypothetical protein
MLGHILVLAGRRLSDLRAFGSLVCSVESFVRAFAFWSEGDLGRIVYYSKPELECSVLLQ